MLLSLIVSIWKRKEDRSPFVCGTNWMPWNQIERYMSRIEFIPDQQSSSSYILSYMIFFISFLSRFLFVFPCFVFYVYKCVEEPFGRKKIWSVPVYKIAIWSFYLCHSYRSLSLSFFLCYCCLFCRYNLVSNYKCTFLGKTTFGVSNLS